MRLFLIAVLPLFSSSLLAQNQVPFPNGAKRVWTFSNGTTAEATLRIRKNTPPTWQNASYQLENPNGDNFFFNPFRPDQLGRKNGLYISPDDAAWIRDAIFLAENQSLIDRPIDPTIFLNPDKTLARNTLQPISVEALAKANGFPAAFCRFALWWDMEGYLRHAKSKDVEKISSYMLDAIEKHYTKRESDKGKFESGVKCLQDFFAREYDVPVVVSAKLENHCSPERLAHYCQGRNATILRFLTYESGKKKYNWFAALSSADATGNVELELHGQVIKGRVKKLDPEDDWKEEMPYGAFEIEILNRSALSLNAITDETRLVIDPQWDGGLWVFRPWILTGKEHLGYVPPPLKPLPVSNGTTTENMLDKVISAVTPSSFDFRSEWKRPQIGFRASMEPSLRTWTKTDGKSAKGTYVSATGAAGNPVAVVLNIGAAQVTIPLNELSPVDRAYVYFVEEIPVKSVRLTYELRESKEKATLIQLDCKPGVATATFPSSENESSGSEGLVAKARSFISDGKSEFEVNYDRLSHSGNPSSIDQKDFEAIDVRIAESVFRPFARGALSQHMTLPCRTVAFDRESQRLQAPGYELSAKFAAFDVPEAACFWKYFAKHSHFKTQLMPCAVLLEAMGKAGVVPLDVIARNKIDPKRAIRLHLVDVAIVEP